MTDLEARYGRHRRSTPRWLWPLVAAIGVSLGVAWAAWGAWSDVPQHQAWVHSYEVVSDEKTTVDLEIYRDAPVALTCRVYAQSVDKAIVGEISVDVPTSTERRVLVPAEIRTERRAVTAVLDACEPR